MQRTLDFAVVLSIIQVPAQVLPPQSGLHLVLSVHGRGSGQGGDGGEELHGGVMCWGGDMRTFPSSIPKSRH